MTSLPSEVTESLSDDKLISEDNPDLDESKDLEEYNTNPFGMSGAKLREIMESDGPTVDAVVLRADGTAQAIRYNSTPRMQDAFRILGSHPTIIGEFRELKVIIVRGRFDEEHENIDEQPLNQHKLRFPFQNVSVRGDILLYRVDDNAQNADFTLDEYNDFISRAGEDIGKEWLPETIAEEDDDKEEDFEEADDEMDALQFDAMLSGIIRNQFLSRFQREPTDEELAAFKDTISAKFVGGMAPGMGLDMVAEEDEEADGDLLDDSDEDDSDYVPNPEEMAQIAAEDAELDAAEDELVDELDEVMAGVDGTDGDSDSDEEFGLSEEGAGLLAKVLASLGGEGAGVSEETMQSGLAALRNGLAMDDEELAFEQQLNEDDDDVDIEQLAKEMKEALKIVKQVGQRDGRQLAEKVSRTFVELNGREPTESELRDAFDRIQDGLADEAEEELTERIIEQISTLPMSDDQKNPMDLISEEERNALIQSASVVVTQSMAETAVEYFTKLTGRTPSEKEFGDLLVSVATTKFVELYCEEGNNDENDEDDLECDALSDKENLDDAIAELLAESEKVNGPRPVPSLAKPVAFYSPVLTPGSSKNKKSRSRVFTSKSLDEQIALRATENFRNRYGREPDESEMDTLRKFLGQTDSLVHTEPIDWDDEGTAQDASADESTRKALFADDGSTAV